MNAAPTDNEIRRMFDLFDSDKSGKVATFMLPTLVRSFDQNPTRKDISVLISEVDPYGSGFFDYADFNRSLLKHWKDPNGEEHRLLRAFQTFDRTKTGHIKVKDLCFLLKTSGDGLGIDEINEFVAFCVSQNLISDDAVDYRGVSKVLAGTYSREKTMGNAENVPSAEKVENLYK